MHLKEESFTGVMKFPGETFSYKNTGYKITSTLLY